MPNISLEKNKQIINWLNWFPLTRKDFFPCVLSVGFALVKSARIWFKLEYIKCSTGVILHHWIQSSYCQWLEWRAEIQADFPFATVSKAVPYELHTKQNNQTKQKRPPPHFQKEIKNLILKQSTVTPGIWEYGFQRENYLSKIPSTSNQCSEKLTDDKAGSKLYSCKGLDASSYIKPGIGKNPALFSKVSLGSGKEEASAHQDMPTWSGLKIPALLFFQTASFHFQVWKGCCQLQDFM